MGRLKLKAPTRFGSSRKAQLRADINRLEGELADVRSRRQMSDDEISELERQLEENKKEQAAGREKLSGLDLFKLDLHAARLRLRK